jgi:hypothetical protein
MREPLNKANRTVMASRLTELKNAMPGDRMADSAVVPPIRMAYIGQTPTDVSG